MVKFALEMTRDTEKVLERALEFYARALFGQLDYVCDILVDSRSDDLPDPPEREAALRELMRRRERAREKLLDAKMEIWPKLLREGHSYGVGHDREADIAWGAYEVLRYTRSWHEHPEGGAGVCFEKPMRWADEPLPTCEIREGE